MATVSPTYNSFDTESNDTSCVATSAAGAAPVFPRLDEDGKWDKIWQTRDQWMKSPGDEDEDGYVSPTESAIVSASKVLKMLQETLECAPKWVVMSGDGGITINIPEGNTQLEIEIDDQGNEELRIFVDEKIALRRKLY